MPAAKLYKSLLTNCGVQLRLHQCQLRKAAVGRSNGNGFVATGAGRIWKWGITRLARSARTFFFVTVSTVWPICCLQFTVSFGVGATVCGYALGGSDKSLTLPALTRLFGSGLPYFSSLLQPLPLPPIFFGKRIGFASISRLALAPVGGSSPPPWRR